MFSLNEAHKYYLCPIPMDMRKGFYPLSGVIRNQMKRNPLIGEVFIFINKNRNTIKLLHWEKGVLVLYHKRLERGCIQLPKYDEISGSYKLQWSDLVLMIEGIYISDVIRRKCFETHVNKGF